MSPLLVASVHLLLIYNLLISVQAFQGAAARNKQVAGAPLAQQQTNHTTNETGAGVDEILRDTFQLLDSLDQRLAQVGNKTKSDEATRETRPLNEPPALQQQQQQSVGGDKNANVQPRDQLKSLVVPNLFSKMNFQQQQAAAAVGELRSLEDDHQLTQMAEQFSSVRKTPAADSKGPDAIDSLAAAASSNDEQTVQTSNRKSARQLTASDEGQQTNLDKFDNNFTENHIRFTLDLMQALFASQTAHAPAPSQSGSLESFLISPVSIQLVLMMMHLGARGQTKRELSNTLHFLTTTTGGTNASSPSIDQGGAASNGPTSLLNNNKNAKLTRRHPQQQHHHQQAGQQRQPGQNAKAAAAGGASGNQQALNNNVHEQFGAAIRQLLKDPNVVRALTSANQIVLQKDLPLAGHYEWAVKHYYGADLRQVDFQNQAESGGARPTNQSAGGQQGGESSGANVRQLINDWVERQTRGKISNFITSPVPTSTLLMALNVLFFKGDWQYKFDPADTDPEAWFTRADGKGVRVPMMVNKLPLAHAHDANMKASVIELPYKAQRLGLFIVLPDEVNGIYETMQLLNSSSFANLISMMRKSAPAGAQSDPHNGGGANGAGGGGINVRIPKFSIDSSPRLARILSNRLGLKTLFAPDLADLSGMFAGGATRPGAQKRTSANQTANWSAGGAEQVAPLQVGLDEFLHKAVLQVHEQGSVAAAASATIVERVGLFNGQYFEADHPFLVFLMDKQTGLVLFSGMFAGPSNGAENSSPQQQQQTNKAAAAGSSNSSLIATHSGGAHKK